jgi:hypothetical protein
VEEWLSGQNTHTLHKPLRKRFPRNPYTITNIDDVSEMRLADLSSLSKNNDKYKYLLNVIDVFSRYAWSVRLKKKTATSITAALKYLFQSRKPITIQADCWRPALVSGEHISMYRLIYLLVNAGQSKI